MGQRRLSFVSVGPGGKPLAVGFNSCAFPHGGCLSIYLSYMSTFCHPWLTVAWS